mgnify:CR=1 FL=1
MNILVFHKIVENTPTDWADVSLSFFNKLIEVIVQKDLTIASLHEWKNNNIGDIALTFDDGLSSDYEFVYPILCEMNLKATFFIVTDFVGKSGYLSWENIMEMSNSGMEIASHSSSHRYMTNLKITDVRDELENSKMKIEENIGKEVCSFAYPYGDCSEQLNKLVIEAGYNNICNSKPGLNHLNSKILYRNSIHSNIATTEINRVLHPKQYEIALQKIGYGARGIVKKSLGINNYLKLRELIF